jgi:signal transduction histidine kinase
MVVQLPEGAESASATIGGRLDAVSSDIDALRMYRILQEALRNVVQHGGTCKATVEIIGSQTTITLCVFDSGIGFDPESIPPGHGLGLISMRERLSLVGGCLSIESKPSCGTRICATAPL